ncbi:hypothetical protein PIB30_096108 [Stylosanthes scabra]|uniref:Major facilitator superfamily (MFS) profile domain-containing protein n=1 Tax=Stylosanthes scabra TaxID=79078 RepID=A0ABU6RW70_9FABA|nr:hypothetical protein [Stylosanthes scabra]
MAQKSSMEVPMKYPAKLTLRVVLTSLMTTTGGLIFGYDHGVSGGVTSMDPFLDRFFPSVYEKESTLKPNSNQYCKFNSQVLTLFTLSASTVTRKLGRRPTMIFGGIFFVGGALLNGLALHLWMLIIGRLLLGFGIRCTNQVQLLLFSV